MACSLLEPKRFKAKRSAEPWTFLPLWRKRNSNERCSRVVTWAQGRKVNVFCEASCKPEASREKVGFRIRAGWWSSSLCLRAQAELRPSCSVSFPPHLLLSSSVIPRPSSDPASRSLGEFLSLSVARLARWRQPRAMASNLSRNFPIYSRLLDSIRRDSDRDIPPTNASLSVYRRLRTRFLPRLSSLREKYIYISILFSRYRHASIASLPFPSLPQHLCLYIFLIIAPRLIVAKLANRYIRPSFLPSFFYSALVFLYRISYFVPDTVYIISYFPSLEN